MRLAEAGEQASGGPALQWFCRAGRLRRPALGESGPGRLDVCGCGMSRPICGWRWSSPADRGGRPRSPCGSRPTWRTTGSSGVSCPRVRHWLAPRAGHAGAQHWTRAKALRVAALIATVQNDRLRAEALLNDARRWPSRCRRRWSPRTSCWSRASPMFAGDNPGALPLMEEALSLFHDAEARSGEMWTLCVLGLTRGLSGEPSSGYADLIACRDMGAASGEVWWRSFALWALSVLRWRDGDTGRRDRGGQGEPRGSQAGRGRAVRGGPVAGVAGLDRRQRTPRPAIRAAARGVPADVAGDAHHAVVVSHAWRTSTTRRCPRSGPGSATAPSTRR